MMRTLQRTSQCQRSHYHEHLPLLILDPLRHLLMLCLLRLLLRHLFRLCLLRLLLMHLLLLLQLPRRPDNMTFSRSNPCSQCHTCSLRCLPPLARQRHCQTRLQRLHRRNLRRRDTSSSMRRTKKIWPWIHSIHCSRKILLYYLYLNINQLLQRILKLVGHAVGLTVKCQMLRLFDILTQLLIRHVKLDKRKLLFLNHLHFRHLIRRREVLPSHRLSSTPTLLRHMDEFMLNWVMIRTSCSGRIWESTTLFSGWTTPKKRPLTTHLT